MENTTVVLRSVKSQEIYARRHMPPSLNANQLRSTPYRYSCTVQCLGSLFRSRDLCHLSEPLSLLYSTVILYGSVRNTVDGTVCMYCTVRAYLRKPVGFAHGAYTVCTAVIFYFNRNI